MSGNRAPTVTIVLPAYVRTDFLRHAIRSALAQRYGDFVLSIGDNSTERCAERIVREFDDPRIEYVAHPRNLGAQGNWFSLIERARTPLVATLHDDDAWHEDFLQRLVPPMLEDPELAMSFGDFDLIDSNGAALPEATAALSAKTRRDRLPEGRIDMDREMALRMVAVWNAPNPAICAVLRRDAVLQTRFAPQAVPLYDIWLSYQLLRRGAAVYYVRSRLSDYRLHAGSATSSGFSNPEDHVFERILLENADAGAVLDEIRRYWAMIRWGRALDDMLIGRRGAASGADIERASDRSRHEFRAAAPHLPPGRAVFARLAAQSTLSWRLMQGLVRCKHRLTGRNSLVPTS